MKEGDVVTLKSGGPKMTICAIGPNARTAETVWFDENDEKFYSQTIAVAALVEYKVQAALRGIK